MVITHTLHPDTHTHGLADDCPRCEQMAQEFPFGWDDVNVSNLVRNTRAWGRGEFRPRSNNEATAMRTVERHLRIAAIIRDTEQ